MYAGSFEDDFAQFRARGRIGSDPQLTLRPAQPQLGDWVEIHCQGLENGHLVCTTGQRWQVGEDSKVRCRVTGPTAWTLYTSSGAPVCTVEAEPQVLVPRLLGWGCPTQVAFDQALLAVDVQAEHAQSIGLAWRMAGQPIWNELPAGVATVPVPQRLARLELRATLRSRHAELSQQATVVAFHRVSVIYPQVALQVDVPTSVVRFEDSEVKVRARWAKSLVLEVAGERVEAQPNALGEFVAARLRVPTAQLGTASVVVTCQGLDGADLHHTFAIEVCARSVNVQIRPGSGGLVDFAIEGAEPVAIELPSRGISFPLLQAQGQLRHAALLPTLLNVVVRDDCGHIQRHAAVLDAAPHVWGQVPTFRPLHWKTV